LGLSRGWLSRTFNDDPSGTYGQNIPCLDTNSLSTAGDTVVLPGLYSGEGVSNAETGTDFTVNVYGEDGEAIGTLNVTVPARSLVQVNRVLADKLGHDGWAWSPPQTPERPSPPTSRWSTE
jgi:hypothetical protein